MPQDDMSNLETLARLAICDLKEQRIIACSNSFRQNIEADNYNEYDKDAMRLADNINEIQVSASRIEELITLMIKKV